MSDAAPASSRSPTSKRGGAPIQRTPRRRLVGKILTILAWTITVLGFLGLLAFAYRKYVLLHPDPTISWQHEGRQYELLNPKLLGAALILPWFVATMAKSLADLPWPQRVLSLLMRFAFVALIAFGLSRLARTTTTQHVFTVYLVDVSNSVPDEALADAREIIATATKEKPEGSEIRTITFARRPKVLTPLPDGSVDIARHGEPKDGQLSEDGAGSNLQAALQLAYGLYAPGFLKRAVLLSDGGQTDGDILAEANRAKELGIRLFTIPYSRPPPGEVALQELKLPDRVKVGETFEIHAKIYASRATTAKAKLYQGEVLNGLEGVKEITLKGGDNDVVFKSVVRIAGPLTYNLELSDLGADTFKENNQVAATVDVPGRPVVLYVEGTPEQATYLSAALTAQQFDVEVRPPVGFPGSMAEMSHYDFVIVSDVSKEQMSLQSQELIKQYVTEGGGFLFAGGEASYGLGNWYNSTIEKILPVRMETKAKEEDPSVAMLLVLDRSGSMTGLPLDMAKAAAKATAETLSPDDMIGVIAFDSSPNVYVRMQPARNRSRISTDIGRIQPGGGTEIFPALDSALQVMTVTSARKKHVILLTDGRAPTDGIRELVSSMVAESITVSTVGLGDVDEQLLRMIADTGGGRFYPVTDPNALPKIFTKETEMITRDAAVEEWFQVVQTGPAQFLANLDVRSAPYLHGYVSTEVKEAPAEQILASDTGEPILARWHVGLGWSLAWTSDVKAKWAVEWLKWQGFELFWGQLVREHMRQKHQRELDMKAEVVDGRVRASIDAFTPDERFENGLTSTLTILGPEPGGKESDCVDPVAGAAPSNAKPEKPKGCMKVVMKQIAPGRYESDVPLPAYGSYLLKAEHVRKTEDGKDKVSAVSYGHVSNPYPREYASFEPNESVLARAATTTGATMRPENVAAVFDPQGEKVTSHEELWSKFIVAAIGVFLLDLLLRRVRIFDRKFVAKPRRV